MTVLEYALGMMLDRLAAELELRDAEIARLRAEMAGPPPPAGRDGVDRAEEEEPPIWATPGWSE